MRLLLFVIFSLVLIPFAKAEPVPGDSCATFPAGSVMRSGGPELGGKIYVMTCTAGLWAVGEINPDPCDDADMVVGTVCLAGTVYAGISPDGGKKMYVMQQDAPGGAGYSWNNGSDTSLDVAEIEPCTNISRTSGCVTGEYNTNILAALSNAHSPYIAAKYCFDLAPPDPLAYGYNDWYLPAEEELLVFHDVPRGKKGSMITGASYQSSSESSGGYHNRMLYSGFPKGGGGVFKNDPYHVRCVRKGAD